MVLKVTRLSDGEQINIEDIERGVYFISVEQNGNRKVEKLVVK